jgi:basic membrane protein A
LFLALALVATACGDDEEGGGSGDSSEKGGGKKVGLVFDVGGRGDKSFNDSAYEGLSRAEKELGVEIKDLEPDEGGENREQLLRDMADEGYELIIGVGFLFGDSMTKVASDYPDTEFAIVDSVVDVENVTSLTFAEQEGSYLMGAVAALKSKTGKIGFVGGVESELIKKFEAGYVAGAKAAKPEIVVEVKYLSPEGDSSGFRDPAKGKTVAQGLYDGGADVVYHAAGGSGSGVFEAAVEKGTFAIGVDSDQYQTAPPEQQKVILTSMLKRVDVAVFETIKSFDEGELDGGVRTFDLKGGGIDYSTSGGQVDDIKTQIDDFKQQIVDGDVDVPTAP